MLGGEHLPHRVPDASGVLDPMNVNQNFTGERLEEVAEQDLVPRKPCPVGRVGNLRWLFIFVRRFDGEGFRRGGVNSFQ
jgi:hypothetical protein